MKKLCMILMVVLCIGLMGCGSSKKESETALTADSFSSKIEESEDDITKAYTDANTGESVTVSYDVRDPEEEDDYKESKVYMMSSSDAGDGDIILIAFLHEFEDEDAAEAEYEEKCFEDEKSKGDSYEISLDEESGSIYGKDGNTTFEILCYQTGCDDVVDTILEKMGY